MLKDRAENSTKSTTLTAPTTPERAIARRINQFRLAKRLDYLRDLT
jgi:hypothetical protein